MAQNTWKIKNGGSGISSLGTGPYGPKPQPCEMFESLQDSGSVGLFRSWGIQNAPVGYINTKQMVLTAAGPGGS